jgi:hypothetical protein
MEDQLNAADQEEEKLVVSRVITSSPVMIKSTVTRPECSREGQQGGGGRGESFIFITSRRVYYDERQRDEREALQSDAR